MNWTLKPHPSFPGVRGPVLICVMDGVGLGDHGDSDAVYVARTPNLDALAARAPTGALRAHGTAVGMPGDDDMGNSEVGHNALGCGRVYDQGAKLVAAAIADGSLFEAATWRALVERCRRHDTSLHLIGLLSDGNVHSHIDHLYALLAQADRADLAVARIHILLDGRDVSATSALEYVDALESRLDALRARGRDYRIASGGGRMHITMDRYEADWAMVERGWQTHVEGAGRGFMSAREAIETFRRDTPGIGDQFLPAFVVVDRDGQPVGPIHDGAAVVFFNFRGDRAIEISQAFEGEHFDGFDRGPRPDVLYAGMMQYDGDLHLPTHFLVEPPAIDATMGEYLARNGASQLAISETQKFGHVTYFWNGNRSGMFDEASERYIEVPSDTRPFEERPWMKAAEITDRLLTELSSGEIRQARVNYANGDMVGHTGHLEATITAMQCLDLQIGRLMRSIRELGGALIVTADHGNADQMFETDSKTGEVLRGEHDQPKPKTSHTLNAVPFHVYAPGAELGMDPTLEKQAGLANVAATALHLMGYDAPADFAPSLLRR